MLIRKKDVINNGTYEEKLAEIVINNKNAQFNHEYNDRLFAKHIIEQKELPDTLLLGASTMLEIGSEEWGNKIQNLSLVTCMVTDIMGVVDLLDKHNKLPKSIVLGLIPTSFNKNVELGNNFRSRDIMKNYTSFCKKISVQPVIPNGNLDLLKYFNPIYLKDNFYKVKNQTINLPEPVETNANIFPEGSKDFTALYNFKTPEEVVAVSNLSSNDLQWTKAATMDPKLVEMFEKTVEWLQARDVSVSIFLLPINPIVWKNTVAKGLKEKYETPENYLKSFAQKQGVFIFGTFNPTGYTIADYFDDKHLKLPAIKGIIDKQMPLYKSHVTNQQSIDYQKN